MKRATPFSVHIDSSWDDLEREVTRLLRGESLWRRMVGRARRFIT